LRCSIKENEEITITALKEPETVEEFSPLDESFFTEPLLLEKSEWNFLM